MSRAESTVLDRPSAPLLPSPRPPAHSPRAGHRDAPPATSPRRSPQLHFVPDVLLVPAAREAQTLRSLAPRTCSLPAKQRLTHHPSLTTLRPLARRAPSQSRSPQLRLGPADPVAKVARKAKEARSPAPLDVLLTSGNRSLVREAAVATSIVYNDASGSKGAADGLCDRYLRMRRARRAGDKCDGLLLHELHTLALRGVLNTPAAATTVHVSCRRPALAPDMLASNSSRLAPMRASGIPLEPQ
jgi:hypothetical protein